MSRPRDTWKRRRKYRKVDEYGKWIKENEGVFPRMQKDMTKAMENRPLFSVVLLEDGAEEEERKRCIRSVRKQSYRNWRWTEAEKDAASSHSEGEEYVVFLSARGQLAPNAFYEMAKTLEQNPAYDFVYSDEDKITRDGKRYQPFFKPDWSPDTMLSFFYTGNLAVYRMEIAKRLRDYWPSRSGEEEYDFALRFMEQSDGLRVGHVTKVLYHGWEKEDSDGEAVREIKEKAMSRRKIQGYLEAAPTGDSEAWDAVRMPGGQWRIVYRALEPARVSIIIPSKDNVKLLRQCVNSIVEVTDYKDYEIIVVDNGSSEENRKRVEELSEKYRFRYHYEPMEFNFSHMCNLGVGLADGDYYLFLNDDIEVKGSQWLERLVGQGAQPHVGAVGAKLLYPESDLIQHAGVIILKPGPSHDLTGIRDQGTCYFGRNRLEYDHCAVTGACLLVDKKKFQEAGGFPEQLPVAYNDMDLCFNLYELGYYNVVRNDVCLYHHESASRGLDSQEKEKMGRLRKERGKLLDRHPGMVQRDPFYNENLVQDNNDYSLHIKQDTMVPNQKRREFKDWKRFEQTFLMNIDYVLYDDDILIRGWFFWEKDYWTNYSRVFLALQKENGSCMLYDVYREEREDVVKVLENDAWDSGIMCRLRRQELTPGTYRIGLWVDKMFLPGGRLCWSEKRVEVD